MSEFNKYQFIRSMLQTLFYEISRRSQSQSLAATVINNVVKDLIPKYDFLKYFKIQNLSNHYEIIMDITSDIDSIESSKFNKACRDIIDKTIKHLGKNADYFFIKEFQESINKNNFLNINEKNIDLGFMKDMRTMQLQHNISKKQELGIDKSELMENLIEKIIRTVNRILREEKAVKIISSIIKKLELKYEFLRYIEMNNTDVFDKTLAIRVSSDINNINRAIIAEAIQKLIEEVGKSLGWGNDELFIVILRKELGDTDLLRINSLGIDLENIKVFLLKQLHELLIKKIIDGLIDITSKKTSKNFAIIELNNSIEKLSEKYDFLKYIKIDKSRYAEGKDVVSVSSEINNIESYKLGKALQDIIKIVGEKFGLKTVSYIDNFKKYVGDECLHLIERIGVNLHLLELKYSMM